MNFRLTHTLAASVNYKPLDLLNGFLGFLFVLRAHLWKSFVSMPPQTSGRDL